ncbi:L-histidine N(alpha)-methyltransferase [Pleurocapsales cyanobacterium LEGE 10410]|nr:L-histidine N(alpha)-methyltransferase [Pleurocapsales cyanobacterium LEGE 10410]
MSISSSANNDRNSLEARLKIDYLLDIKALEQDDVEDVIDGLGTTPKSLPARYFYDERGSQLFEEICQLPEYYPTRTEAGILQKYATQIIERTKAIELIELGSGSSTKTRFLLDVYRAFNLPLYYTPVDVSGSILRASAENLLTDYPKLKVQGKVATYSQALQQLSTSFLGKRIIIFLGSSIGNFNPTECDRFIEQITTALKPGDYFLLGIDLQKPPAILESAYNDSQEVTAAFNLNMLQHLNNRFQGNFNLDLFKHQAVYNQTEHQIEMYLISQQAQTVTLESLDLTVKLEREERILTEISRKFDLAAMKQYLGDRHLNLIQTYTDPQQWFGLLLCQFSP